MMQSWLEGLRERGYVVGQNLQIEYRYSQAQTERIPALVSELVALSPEVIVAASSPNAVAVHADAPTIPLVFVGVGDPVAVGLVESLAHPGGNVTGFANVVPEGFVGKQLQFLKTLVPQTSRIAVLVNPKNPLHLRDQARLAEFGRLLGVELVIVEASKPEQLETAFEAARKEGAEGIHVLGDPLIFIHSVKVVSLAARYRLPAMYLNPRNVQDGGLMSYGPNNVALRRRAGAYVDKILKGEKAGDLPVEQPTRFYLTVNLKTAAELGITVPPSILAQADEVIE
jgi:putative tryptophan/tyrosine transport system substrate-binding protein